RTNRLARQPGRIALVRTLCARRNRRRCLGNFRTPARLRQCRRDRIYPHALRILFFCDIRQARTLLGTDRRGTAVSRGRLVDRAHAPPTDRGDRRSRAMKPIHAGLLVAAAQVLIVAGVGGKYWFDREHYPHVWVETRPVDPNLP